MDHRKLKVYSDMVFKADKLAAEETGQLPQRVDGLDSRYTAPVLGIRGSFDYTRFAEVEAQRKAEWEAGAAEREAEEQRRKAESDALMKSIRDRIEAQVEAHQLAMAGAVADRIDWSALEDDEADEASEGEEADVQELYRVNVS